MAASLSPILIQFMMVLLYGAAGWAVRHYAGPSGSPVPTPATPATPNLPAGVPDLLQAFEQKILDQARDKLLSHFTTAVTTPPATPSATTPK